MILENRDGSIIMEIVEVDEEIFLKDFSFPILKARKLFPDKRKSKGKRRNLLKY